MAQALTHAHTDASNHNTRDSIIKTHELIDIALELQLVGVAITDHAVLSNHIKAIKYLKELREKAEGAEKERLNKFKLMLGCEIYLVNKDEIDKARNNNQSTKFYHLVVIAKNKKGYRQLAKISSQGWDNSFYHRGMERTPVYKEDLEHYVRGKNNKGNLIVTSACLGSEFAQLVLAFLEAKKAGNKERMVKIELEIKEYLLYMVNLFGDDYYIELQPSFNEEQIEYNKFALDIAKFFGIKAIVTTDAHYQRPDFKKTHSDYLKSQNAERETESFYSSTYIMTEEEIREYLYYFSDEEVAQLLQNTVEIADKVEEYDLHEPTKVPNATIEYDNFRPSKFATILDLESKYPYIYKYFYSEHLIDRIILQQIEIGMEEKGQEYDTINLSRINEELESMWGVSEGLGERLSSYYVLTKEIVDLIWTVSLVGVSRGSAGAFYIAYLLGITQINPINYNLPSWRHL